MIHVVEAKRVEGPESCMNAALICSQVKLKHILSLLDNGRLSLVLLWVQ